MTIKCTVEPAEVGLDPARLATLDRHFAAYVDSGKLAGWHIVVTRRGQVAHSTTYGRRDLEGDAPVTADTLWRIYSMSKPVTSVAAMILWEEGRFELTDEVSRWLPEFADVRVYDKGSAVRPFTVPAMEPVRVWHLLTHTSGLTYGFLETSVVDRLYREAGYGLDLGAGADLTSAVRTWAKLPLLFQPGSRWGYGVSTDVLGRLIEVVSGQSLEAFVQERVLGPLGMTDTGWWAPPEAHDRLAALYVANPATGAALRYDSLGTRALTRPELVAGGSGLVSTAQDYHRFTQMLLGEGTVDGVKLLGSRTVRYMTRNHLPGNQDLATLYTGGGFAETIFDGIGFGLGFAVVLDPVAGKVPTTEGSYYWGGMASTAFWVDPREELTAMLFTQLVPSSTYPLRPQLRQLVYSALV